MKYEEYIRVQEQTSEWTRLNPTSIALVRDSCYEFSKHVSKHSRVCEVGCGDGYAMDILRARGYQQPVGCDINAAKLEIAVSFGHAVALQDLHYLGFQSNVFDAVYCTHTLEHSHDGYQALREICRVLRPGGTALVIVPDHAQTYGDTFVESVELVPLEQRPSEIFEAKMLERKGFRSSLPRNQFPFTMRLLLTALFEAQLEVQWAARVARNGPELWAIATKPDLGSDYVEPLLDRDWQQKSILRMAASSTASRIAKAFSRLLDILTEKTEKSSN
jgi:SAM-dependent methyltransferase